MDTSVSDEDAKKAAAGFASGRRSAIATVTDAAATSTLEVRKDKDKNYYAKSSVVEGIYKVAADLGDALDKGLDDFRNKKLFDFGFSDPSKVELKGVTYTKSRRQVDPGRQDDGQHHRPEPDRQAARPAATKFVENTGGGTRSSRPPSPPTTASGSKR